MAVEKIIKKRNFKSDEKKMIIDNVSSIAAEKMKKRSKIEYDEKKTITDSALSMVAEKMNISETESGRLCSWSDLQTDMVRVILHELPSFGDRIRARAVCKNWLLPLNEILIPRSELPLVMTFKWHKTIDIQGNLSECKLFDPLYKKQKSSKDEEELKKTSNNLNLFLPTSQIMKYPDTKVCASKNGWVMFYHFSSQRIVCPAFREQKTSFFLYNPFTKHTVTLPDLITPYIGFYNSFDIATFTSSPEEDDCVFFAVRRELYKQKQSIIATYRHNILEQQQNWKIDQFKEENGNGIGSGMISIDQIAGSVYIDGIFYCVSLYGTLMSFNVALHEWTNLTTLCPIPNDNRHYAYIVESNGELLLVFECYTFKRLYVFDKSSNVWVSRENRYLRDRALFLGSYGSFAVSVDGGDDDQNEIANKAYYCDLGLGHTTTCYSFTNISDNWEENLKKVGSRRTIIWIQPPSKF